MKKYFSLAFAASAIFLAAFSGGFGSSMIGGSGGFGSGFSNGGVFPNAASAFFANTSFNSTDPNSPYLFGTSSQYNFEYTQPFSVCAWVLPGQQLSASTLAGKINISPDHTVDRGWQFGTNGAGTDGFGTSLYFSLANTITVRAMITSYPSNDLHQGQYSFACATSDGTGTIAGMHIYVNAALQALGNINIDALAGNTILNSVPFTVGGMTTNTSSEGYERFSGNINQLTTWGVALTQNQINSLYRNTSPNDPRINGPTANLLGYYPLIDVTDTTSVIHDVVGGNNLTNNLVGLNGITLPSPVFQNVSEAIFGGVDSYVDLGNNFGTNVRTSPASYTFFITPNALPAASNYFWLFGKLDPVGGAGFGAYMNKADGTDPTSINFVITGGGEYRLNGPTGFFTQGVKKHVGITYDGTNANGIKLYGDGSQVTATVVSNNATTSADVGNAFRIGARTDGSFPLNANVDEFAIFNRVLTSTEISQIYSGGTVTDIKSRSPLGWYRFENGGQYLGYAPDLTTNVGDRGGFVTGTLHNVLYSNTPSSSFVNSKSGTYNGTTSASDFGASFNQIDLHTHAHSWNFWFKEGTVLNGNGNNGLFGTYSTANSTGFGLLLDTRMLWYEAAGAGHRINVNTGNVLTINDGVWHMGTITVDSTGLAGGASIFLDSVRQAVTITEDALNGTTVNTSHFVLGNMGSTAPYQFSGSIDMFSDYPDYILTQYDIDNLYSLESPGRKIADPRVLPAAAYMDAFLPIGEGSDTTSTLFDLIASHNATNSNVTLGSSVP